MSNRELRADVWRLAWPATLMLLLSQFVDVLDIAFVGRLGRDSVAAFGYAAQFQTLFLSVVMALGSGVVSVMSRRLGAGQERDARVVLAAAMIFVECFALLAAVVVMIWPRVLLGWLNAPDEIADRCVPFFRLLLSASLFIGIASVFEAAFRSHQDTRTPLKVAGVMIVVKLVLNPILIFGVLGNEALGLVGAGIASLCARASAVLAYLYLLRGRARSDNALGFSLSNLRRAPTVFREVLSVCAPAVVERLCMSGALLIYFSMLSGFGSSAIAAYTLGTRLLGYSWLPGVGIALASTAYVGHAIGRGDPQLARRAAWQSVRIAFVLMTTLGVSCIVFHNALATAFTDDPEIIAELLPFIFTLGFVQPMMALHFPLSGALRGAGDTVSPMISSLVSSWLCRVPFALSVVYVWELPLYWMWVAIVLDHTMRAVWNVLAFTRSRRLRVVPA